METKIFHLGILSEALPDALRISQLLLSLKNEIEP